FGSDFDTVLAVYTGACGALTQVGCNDQTGGSNTSQIISTVTAGTTYRILAGGSGGVFGNLVFHLVLAQSPAVVAQPASNTVAVGGSATFSVTATGTTPLSYFWRRNGQPISGATTSSYTTN